MLETRNFFPHPIKKPPASTLESRILTLFCKKNLWPLTKTWRATPPSWLLCLGRPMATCTLSTSRLFWNTMLATLWSSTPLNTRDWTHMKIYWSDFQLTSSRTVSPIINNIIYIASPRRAYPITWCIGHNKINRSKTYIKTKCYWLLMIHWLRWLHCMATSA